MDVEISALLYIVRVVKNTFVKIMELMSNIAVQKIWVIVKIAHINVKRVVKNNVLGVNKKNSKIHVVKTRQSLGKFNMIISMELNTAN